VPRRDGVDAERGRERADEREEADAGTVRESDVDRADQRERTVVDSATGKTMNATAPTAAPEETPMIDGSAIGLRKNPCMTVPAAASAKPTSAANRIRGSLTPTTICWWTPSTGNANGD